MVNEKPVPGKPPYKPMGYTVGSLVPLRCGRCNLAIKHAWEVKDATGHTVWLGDDCVEFAASTTKTKAWPTAVSRAKKYLERLSYEDRAVLLRKAVPARIGSHQIKCWEDVLRLGLNGKDWLDPLRVRFLIDAALERFRVEDVE